MNWILPPWITVPWKFIKAVPWHVWATIALVIAGWLAANAIYQSGVDATNAEWQTRFDNANAVAAEKARKAEKEHEAEIDRIAENLIQERNRGFEERDKTIADLRDGTRRVRDRFKCPTRPALPNAGNTAAGSNGGTQGGLSDNDAEFLIREAGRADEITRQLSACQAVIRSDRR